LLIEARPAFKAVAKVEEVVEKAFFLDLEWFRFPFINQIEYEGERVG
jgi:hypothetical protein